jgi:hypothetical protein
MRDERGTPENVMALVLDERCKTRDVGKAVVLTGCDAKREVGAAVIVHCIGLCSDGSFAL